MIGLHQQRRHFLNNIQTNGASSQQSTSLVGKATITSMHMSATASRSMEVVLAVELLNTVKVMMYTMICDDVCN